MLKKHLLKAVFVSQLFFLLLPNATGLRGETIIHFKNPHGSWSEVLRSKPIDSLPAVVDSMNVSKTFIAPAITLNKQAKKFIKTYMVRESEALELCKRRSINYFDAMDEVFESYQLPVELKYLAVVESDLKTSAYSKAGARGIWQFMPQTARDLGLRVKGNTDERTQVRKSTIAAAKYLRQLHEEFGDWLLVMAAYNSGPGPVRAAIKKCGSRNFWAIQSSLPAESRGHVKRYIAIHYYFEGKAGLTMLTAAETKAYNKLVDKHRANLKDFSVLADSPVVAVVSPK